MRNLPTELSNEFDGFSIRPVLMASLHFDSGTIGIWSGFGQFDWDGITFYGSGNFLGLSNVDETENIEARGIIISMNGVSSALVAAALSEKIRGRRFRLYVAAVADSNFLLTEDSDFVLTEGGDFIELESEFVSEPYRLFSGLMDTIKISDNGQDATISLQVENSLIAGRRNKVERYTHEQQKLLFPGDNGLNLVNALQDKSIVW